VFFEKNGLRKNNVDFELTAQQQNIKVGLFGGNNNKHTFIFRHLQENQNSSGLQTEVGYKMMWLLSL